MILGYFLLLSMRQTIILYRAKIHIFFLERKPSALFFLFILMLFHPTIVFKWKRSLQPDIFQW